MDEETVKILMVLVGQRVTQALTEAKEEVLRRGLSEEAFRTAVLICLVHETACAACGIGPSDRSGVSEALLAHAHGLAEKIWDTLDRALGLKVPRLEDLPWPEGRSGQT